MSIFQMQQMWRTGLTRGLTPGRTWIWARRLTQSIALAALILGPLWGGWARLDDSTLAAWRQGGASLSPAVSRMIASGGTPAFIDRDPPILGGGIAAEYVSIPLMDPVAGALALVATHGSWRTWVALSLPVLLAMMAGRFFCGWLCPFGVLARSIDRLLDLFLWRSRYRLPRRRPLRWLVLGGAITASLLGVHMVLYISLPYLLLQQSVYAMWLLGGGGAVLAVLLGLLVAGVIMGPTSYCAALCPTGAALSLLGRARPVHLTLAEPSACGRRCQLCTEACWLHLDPASGEPGPDCDLCMRCVAVCPRSNLRFQVSKPARDAWTILPLLIAAWGLTALVAPIAAAEGPMRKPRLLLEREHRLGDVTLALSVVDFSGVALDADAQAPMESAELSLFLARGVQGQADARGILPRRQVYTGPLTLKLTRASGSRMERLVFDAPTSPISTAERTLYRRRLPDPLSSGDTLTLNPIRGWLEQPVSWTVPPERYKVLLGPGLHLFGTALLIGLGILSLAFVVSAKGNHLKPKRTGIAITES